MSSWITELLETTRRTNKLHESFLRNLCETYHLTMTEASIICFLKNNPQLDTAADIVEYKMLAKSHVSQLFFQELFSGFTADEQNQFFAFNQRIINNTKNMLERRKYL